MMYSVIHLFFLIPAVGFLFSLLVSAHREKLISSIAWFTQILSLLLVVFYLAFWLFQGAPTMNFIDVSVYHQKGFDFFLDFYFDSSTAVFLFTGNLIVFIVVSYSRNYMHNDSGYKRFFNTILFFHMGYVITVLAGNFETLFIGWEILGVSSFLLIAYYRLRYLPVRNAVKVFTIYRIGDVGILMAMWMSHHVWEENITFLKLHNDALVTEHLYLHEGAGMFLSFMVLIAALAKSAQFPFSSWLPRAMEGPTPSSAVFYGSLSVHMGAFLLIRTHPFWEHQPIVVGIIIAIGTVTAILSTFSARVQSTIKGQIAYSSIAQIGIIFIEIACGWEKLALWHFAGNAFLRTYELLISPSAVAYLIRDRFYRYKGNSPTTANAFFSLCKNTFYTLSLKEWKLESLVFRLFVKPLKMLRRIIGFISLGNVIFILLPFYVLGLILVYNYPETITASRHFLAILAALLALMLVAKSYHEKTSSRLAWGLILFAHFFVDLSVALNDHLDLKEASLYLGGILVSSLAGFMVLLYLKKKEHRHLDLDKYRGMVRDYPVAAFIFLLAALGVSGFPITTTFFGEDLVLNHIHEDQVILAFLVSITFIVNGLAVMRMYARLFLGGLQKDLINKTDLTY